MDERLSQGGEDLRHTHGFEEDEEMVKMANILWRVHRETLPPKGR